MFKLSMASVFKKLEYYKQAAAIRYLQNSNAEKLEAFARKNLKLNFNRFVKYSQAYQHILLKAGVKIKSEKRQSNFFQQLPILTKENFFELFTASDILGENLNKVKLTMTSSGFSGIFSYGFIAQKSLNKSKFGVDTTLNYWFNIHKIKTFLINCAPMGVHVETSVTLAETSVRSDIVLALVKKISPEYGQTIIVGDPYFLKKVVEEGCEMGIPWSKYKVSLITAQDWLPESLRTYLASKLEINLDTDTQRGIFATMGMTELGLNVFHETRNTIKLRRKIIEDKVLRNKLISTQYNIAPTIFVYYPFRTFIENNKVDGSNEMLFSVTDPSSIMPLMRYSTGDSGILFKYSEMAELLKGYPNSFKPELKLPVAFMCGRTKNLIHTKKGSLTIEDIKEGLFSDPAISQNITGLIQLKNNPPIPTLLVQLKQNSQLHPEFNNNIGKSVNLFLPFSIEVKALPYFDFPGGTELNYERKLSKGVI